jgi:hypothetical protein
LEKFTKNIAVEKQRFSWENMVSSIERLVGMIKK